MRLQNYLTEEMWQGIKIQGKFKKLLDDIDKGKGIYKNSSLVSKELISQESCPECYGNKKYKPHIVKIIYNQRVQRAGRKTRHIWFCVECDEIVKRLGF